MNEGRRIRSMDPLVVRSIATGQIICDLATSIKELLDNSIDAGSTQIGKSALTNQISIVDSGLSSFEVTDNGCGIDQSNFEMIGMAHCTSKIVPSSVIFEEPKNESIKETLGFRGEALYALGSISGRVTIFSCTSGEAIGRCREVEGGVGNNQWQNRPEKNIRMNVGTRVKIEELFASLPVRRAEWERNAKRHLQRALWLIQSYALAYPNVRFRCTLTNSTTKTVASSNVLFATPGGPLTTTRMVVEAIYGGQAQSLIALESSDRLGKSTQLKGLISRKADRPSGDRQFLTVNQRPCEMFSRLAREINGVYRNLAKDNADRYPFVYLEISTPFVDVNLVPDKRTIGIPDEADLISKIKDLIYDRLTSEIVPVLPVKRASEIAVMSDSQSSILESSPFLVPSQSLSLKRDEIYSQNMVPSPSKSANSASTKNSLIDLSSQSESCISPSCCGDSSKNDNPFTSSVNFLKVASETEGHLQDSLEDERILCKDDFQRMQIIGQFNCGFILCSLPGTSGGTQLYIIDQHAADERFRLEQLTRGLETSVQVLLHPMHLTGIGSDDRLFIEMHQAELRQLGYRLKIDEENGEIALLTIPMVEGVSITGVDNEFKETLGLLRQPKFGTKSSPLPLSTRVSEKLASRACRSAVMIGSPLDRSAQIQIVRNLTNLDNPWICAHGRPTVRLLAILP